MDRRPSELLSLGPHSGVRRSLLSWTPVLDAAQVFEIDVTPAALRIGDDGLQPQWRRVGIAGRGQHPFAPRAIPPSPEDDGFSRRSS
jgi:hypothetical protein